MLTPAAACFRARVHRRVPLPTADPAPEPLAAGPSCLGSATGSRLRLSLELRLTDGAASLTGSIQELVRSQSIKPC